MSPEQARGEVLDARTDLFSFGVVVYEMATATQAFTGQTTAVIFEAILSRQPSAFDRIPPDLARLIRKAIEKDRTFRYQTAVEFRGDLKRLKRDSDSGRSTAAPAMAGQRQDIPNPDRRRRLQEAAPPTIRSLYSCAMTMFNPSFRIAIRILEIRSQFSDWDRYPASCDHNSQIGTAVLELRSQFANWDRNP